MTVVIFILNQSQSIIYDILKTAILFRYYDECMRMLRGMVIYSKPQWKDMIWRRAWEIEKSDWSYRSTIYKATYNLSPIGNGGSYLVWWQISDSLPSLMKQCELMATLVCGVKE